MSLERRLAKLEQIEAQSRVPPAPSGYGTHIYGMDEDGMLVDAVSCLIDGWRAWVSVEEFYARFPDGELMESYPPE